MSSVLRLGSGTFRISQGTTIIESALGPHSPPTSFAFTAEGADTSGPTSFGIFPTMFIGDLMLAVFTSQALPNTYTLNTPTAGSGGPWIQLFNGTMDTDDERKTSVWARVASATDFSAVTFSTSGASFAQSCAELYRVPAGSHNASSGSDVVIESTLEGSNVAAGTYPAATITNSRRLVYVGAFHGNNGNDHTPATPAGTTLINYNGGGDTSGKLLDFNDQTEGAKSSFGITFPSANADYKFFAITYP